jgi:hypothetical protein
MHVRVFAPSNTPAIVCGQIGRVHVIRYSSQCMATSRIAHCLHAIKANVDLVALPAAVPPKKDAAASPATPVTAAAAGVRVSMVATHMG